MNTKFEDEYLDILQNIEFAIVYLYRQHPEMIDHQVDKSIEGLIRAYQAQQRGRSTPTLKLGAIEQQLYDDVQVICEFHQGHLDMEKADAEARLANLKIRTADEIIACLKRIRSSISLWTKEGGRKGYLTFISQFVP